MGRTYPGNPVRSVLPGVPVAGQSYPGSFLIMADEINPRSPVPAYLQLAGIIEDMISSGELQPDNPVPSESWLQQRYGIARNTARHAVHHLRDKGLVYTVPGRGTYVSPKG